MTTQTINHGARSSTILTAGALASGNYITGAAIDLGGGTTKVPAAITLQMVATPSAATSGSKQLALFGKWSQDGTTYGSGPESGTSTTNEIDLALLGALPMNDTGSHVVTVVVQPRARWFKPIYKNEAGVALTSGELYRVDLTGDST